jgi:hypothetical protein
LKILNYLKKKLFSQVTKHSLLLWLLIGISLSTLAQRFPKEALNGEWRLTQAKFYTEKSPRLITKAHASGYILAFNGDTLTTIQESISWKTGTTSFDTSVYTYEFKKKGFDAIITATAIDSTKNKKVITLAKFNSFKVQIVEEYQGNNATIFNPESSIYYTFSRDTNNIHYETLKMLNTKLYCNISPYADSLLLQDKIILQRDKNYSLNTEQNQTVFFPDTVYTTLHLDTTALYIHAKSTLGARRPEFKENPDFHRKSYTERCDITYPLFYIYPNRQSIEIYLLDDQSTVFKYQISDSGLLLLSQ